ncbi:glycosyl hydrolase [Actinopolymorpha sp. NPDC004070]|uniref:glycosyl hydrolase n=1 Tax=Actinopolymorpha sp. NPDC004070 TaxID=3154548 RepID=UPI0033BD0F89
MLLEELRRTFAEPPEDARPMLRWWWFGPAVDEASLDRQLQTVAAAGFGGVEVAYVYPLAPATSDFGSPHFHELLRHAGLRCQELGLRFDLTLGSGWSFGGPDITPDLAARRLHWELRELTPGPSRVPVMPGDEFVAAYLFAGSVHDRTEAYTLLDTLDVPDGIGPRTLLVATSRPTGQNVKRAAAGAEGPVLDHYSTAATLAHIRGVAEPLLDAVAPAPVGSVFCDSLEVYSSDWTPEVLAEFGKRRGYDPLPLLPLLRFDIGDFRAFRADFLRTLSELYQENFVAVFGDWARGRGVPFRIQSYGVPPASVSSYRYADVAEGEGWGWSGLPQTRWASSAAHLYGQKIVSSEVWTWVHSPSFRATPLDLQAEAHEHFLCGVNQLVGHGLPYTPTGAPGLGWFFYAAGALDDRNPWWDDAAPELTAYLQRLCWLLRQGEPVADVKLHVSFDDVYPQLDLWKATAAKLGDVVRRIRTGGWDFDLVDDEAIAQLGLESVLTPPDLTDLCNLPGIPAPDVEVGSDAIGVTHRRLGDIDIYFAANTANTRQVTTFTPRTRRSSYEQWDARNGSVVRSGSGPTVDLALDAYEATVIVTFDGPVQARTPGAEAGRRPLTGFTFGGEAVELPHRWEDTRRGYSGQGEYETHVHLDSVGDRRLFLDFGDPRPITEDRPRTLRSFRALVRPPVGEVVRVYVNGSDAGAVWSAPYRIEITHLVRAGDNTLRLVVSNTAANALTEETEIHRLAADSERRYGRRFAMQELDRAGDDLHSGLLTTPALVEWSR